MGQITITATGFEQIHSYQKLQLTMSLSLSLISRKKNEEKHDNRRDWIIVMVLWYHTMQNIYLNYTVYGSPQDANTVAAAGSMEIIDNKLLINLRYAEPRNYGPDALWLAPLTVT